MSDHKITPMLPHFHPKNNLIFGATSSYYYVFSSDLKDMFFYKSKVNRVEAKEEMTNPEIRHLLNVVMTEIDDSFKPMVRMIQYKFETEYALKPRSQQIDQLKTNKVFTTQQNNSAQEQRKARQRDRELSKYSSIHPVVILDENKNINAVFAKLDGEYCYVSAEKGKEGFWQLSLTKSKPMPTEKVASLLEYFGQSTQTQAFAENMAFLYRSFLKRGTPNLSDWQNEVMYSKARIELAKGLQSFSPVQRALCLKGKQHTRA